MTHLRWFVLVLVLLSLGFSPQSVFAQEELISGQQVQASLQADPVFEVKLWTIPQIDQGQDGLVIMTVQNITNTNQIFDAGVYIPESYLRDSAISNATKGDLRIVGQKSNGITWTVDLTPNEVATLTVTAPAISRPGLIPDFYLIRMADQFRKLPLKILGVNLSMAYLPLIQQQGAVVSAGLQEVEITDSGMYTQTLSGGIASIMYDGSLLEGAEYAKFIVTVNPNDEPGDIFTIWVRFPSQYLNDSIKYTGTGGFYYPETEDGKINELQWVVGLRTSEESLIVTVPIVEAAGGTTMEDFYFWQLQDGEPFQSRDLKILPIRSRIYIVIAQNGPSPIQPAGE